MNANAKTKVEFIKFNNSRELFKELYNVCMLFKNTDHWYYCNCRNLRSGKIKCALCKFDDSFDDKSQEKYMIAHRHDIEKLQKIVDRYWSFVQMVQKEDQSALDFFNKEYVWTYRDYRNHIDMRCDIENIIESNEEIINSSGLDHFFNYYI